MEERVEENSGWEEIYKGRMREEVEVEKRGYRRTIYELGRRDRREGVR
jgi:hypothetical protein